MSLEASRPHGSVRADMLEGRSCPLTYLTVFQKARKIFIREGKLIYIIYLDFETAFHNITHINNDIQKDQGERQFVDID